MEWISIAIRSQFRRISGLFRWLSEGYFSEIWDILGAVQAYGIKGFRCQKRTTVYGHCQRSEYLHRNGVHRALHDGAGISPATKKKVLRMAKRLGYRPNLAARTLSQKRKPRISVNTLQGTTSFWDEVRAGVLEEARAQGIENIEIEFRTFPNLGEGDDEAFLAATDGGADGVITFPSRPKRFAEMDPARIAREGADGVRGDGRAGIGTRGGGFDRHTGERIAGGGFDGPVFWAGRDA